jgi:hypothetical protein
MAPRLGAGLHVRDVVLGATDEVDAVFAAALGFEEGRVGAGEDIVDGPAVAGEADQASR